MHKVEAKGLKKPYNDDFVQFCIHLTATSQSVHFRFGWWTIVVALKVSQGKAFFISSASPGLFLYTATIHFFMALTCLSNLFENEA